MNKQERTNRRLSGEGGFSLIELMVVVLIIGVLLGIAIPRFMSAREGAQDRSAQASVRIAQQNAEAIFTANNDYREVTEDTMSEAEPGLEWGPSEDNKTVFLTTAGGNAQESAAFFAVKSATGYCFAVYLPATEISVPIASAPSGITTGDASVQYGTSVDRAAGQACTDGIDYEWDSEDWSR